MTNKTVNLVHPNGAIELVRDYGGIVNLTPPLEHGPGRYGVVDYDDPMTVVGIVERVQVTELRFGQGHPEDIPFLKPFHVEDGLVRLAGGPGVERVFRLFNMVIRDTQRHRDTYMKMADDSHKDWGRAVKKQNSAGYAYELLAARAHQLRNHNMWLVLTLLSVLSAVAVVLFAGDVSW